MNYKSLLDSWCYELKTLYDEREIKNVFNLVAEHLHQWNRLNVLLNIQKEVALHDQIAWREILERLKTNEPIQHILGKAYFYDLDLMVDQNTLIPRPETEELVHLIIQDFKQRPIDVLDVGTGSGCIILALAHNLSGKFYGLDISEKALKIASLNNKKLGLDVHFKCDSILEPHLSYPQFDVIVSNPPYIPYQEMPQIGNNVLDHEPHLALFVEDANPILFYQVIFDFAQEHLKVNGVLYFELNPLYKEDVVNYILKNSHWNCGVFEDLQGKDRILKATKTQ